MTQMCIRDRYKWEHLVRDASRVDRGADDEQIVSPVCMNFFAAFRQREIIGIHRDAECVSEDVYKRQGDGERDADGR